MPNYAKPDIIQKFSGVKVELWHWIEKNIGNQDGSFEIDQGKLADRFDVSRTSIINALKTFVSANLMEKVDTGKGRGNHCQYKLIWTFKTENELKCNPSHVYSKPQEKFITKGRQWRYFAYKFRTTVENSSLADSSQVIVGRILNYLEGKPPDLFKETLTYLKRWLNEGSRMLKGFFAEFFHKILKGLVQSQRELEQTEKMIREQREQREKVRKEYEEDPPPRLKDYNKMSEYQKAIEKWEENHD